MTIRRNTDLSRFSADLSAVQTAIDATGRDTFKRADEIVNFIGNQCDALLNSAKDLNIGTCNCDGIREIEALMFDMVRRNATIADDQEISRAMKIGYALDDFPASTGTIIKIVDSYGEAGADMLDSEYLARKEREEEEMTA